MALCKNFMKRQVIIPKLQMKAQLGPWDGAVAAGSAGAGAGAAAAAGALAPVSMAQ